ncbi:MAG: cation-translocating P-type ATPase [Bacteroidota bacterium]
MKTTTFHIIGMCCATEQSLIEAKIRELPYVKHIAINLLAEKLTVEFSGNDQSIIHELQKIGFGARVQQTKDTRTYWEKNETLILTCASLLLALSGFITASTANVALLSKIIFLASIATGGFKVFIKAFHSLKQLHLEMNVLMAVATLGAITIGELEEASVVILLFSFSLFLEQTSLKRTRKAIDSLMKQSPTKANVLRNSIEENELVENIVKGEIIIVRPGEIIPLDGIVVSGNSFVNQSAITGESVPVDKKPLDKVYAGTINQNGSLDIQVTEWSTDTVLVKILHSIEVAQSEKAHSQQFAERFAKIYTPIVFLFAILVATLSPLLFHLSFSISFYNALVLLVVACPCALVISTPVTVISALTTAARNGILIKGGKHLEVLGEVQAIAFDKTGTLSEGRLNVSDIVLKNSFSKEEILKIITALESRSEHHFADAMKRYCTENYIQKNGLSIDEFQTIPGKGISGKINSALYYFGNLALIKEVGCSVQSIEKELHSYEQKGESVSLLCDEKEILALVTFSDTEKSNAKEVIASLKESGIKKTIILSGDSEYVAKRFANLLNVDEYHSSLLPNDKISAIRELQRKYKTVAMVGDGINDAPALAAANIGIAMGTNGTDTAIDTADVVLMSDNLQKIPEIIRLSRTTMKILKQNIIFAIGIKSIIFLMGIFGFASLWMAILADDGATIIVIANALRLLKRKIN